MKYRYESLAVILSELQNHVPGMPSVETVTTPVTIDVTVDAASKPDLDDYMTGKGWKYIGTVA